MFKRFTVRIGISLILLCLLSVCLSDTIRSKPQGTTYISPGDRHYQLNRIETERNGSIRVNTAGYEELTSLTGIGPVYAERIISERNENGPYYYPEDLEAVKGIGPQTSGKIRMMIDLTLEKGGN